VLSSTFIRNNEHVVVQRRSVDNVHAAHSLTKANKKTNQCQTALSHVEPQEGVSKRVLSLVADDHRASGGTSDTVSKRVLSLVADDHRASGGTSDTASKRVLSLVADDHRASGGTSDTASKRVLSLVADDHRASGGTSDTVSKRVLSLVADDHRASGGTSDTAFTRMLICEAHLAPHNSTAQKIEAALIVGMHDQYDCQHESRISEHLLC
jgi:hypothetical protein